MTDNNYSGDKNSRISDSFRRGGKFGIPVAIALLLLVLLIGASALAQLAGAGKSAGNVSTAAPKVGSLAPDFELVDVRSGQPFRLSSLRGKPVWINFWATWCPPCKTELPVMKQKYDKYKKQGLTIVGVDMQEDPALVKAYADDNGFDWMFVADRDGAVTNRYFTSGIPTHLFVDESGIIQALYVGDLEEASMDELLSKIVRVP